MQQYFLGFLLAWRVCVCVCVAMRNPTRFHPWNVRTDRVLPHAFFFAETGRASIRRSTDLRGEF